jgi:hypothetical protein
MLSDIKKEIPEGIGKVVRVLFAEPSVYLPIHSSKLPKRRMPIVEWNL